MTKKEFENLRNSDILVKDSKLYSILGMARINGIHDYELVDENGKIFFLTEDNHLEYNVIKGNDR